MNGYVGNTDFDWYSFLRSQPALDEVNFWLPSDKRVFRAVPAGAPFFFRLKSPYNAIAGFGFFTHHTVVPSWVAWESFGIANGAPDYDSMLSRLEKYRRRFKGRPSERPGDYEIGCLVITQPVFFERKDWVEDLRDWRPNIVQGKSLDLSGGEGLRVYTDCLGRAAALRQPVGLELVEKNRYGEPVLVAPRLGQGAFRLSVTDAYGRSCTVTEEHSLPVLDAAHILPFGQGGKHEVQNGLLLRSDIHRLFDQGYVTVTPDYRFKVSDALREDYSNGRSYYGFDGKRICLPSDREAQPCRDYLDRHASEVFRA